MREVRSWFGYDAHELEGLIGSRRVIVWGGNASCVEVLAFLRDRCRCDQGDVLCMQSMGFSLFKNYSIHHPQFFLKNQSISPEHHFVVVASVSYRKKIVEYLEGHDMQHGRDFIYAHQLFRRKMMLRMYPDDCLDVETILHFFQNDRKKIAGGTLEIAGFPNFTDRRGIDALLAALSNVIPVTLSLYAPSADIIAWSKKYVFRLRFNIYTDHSVFKTQFPDVNVPCIDEWLTLGKQIDPSIPIEYVSIGDRQPNRDDIELPNLIRTEDEIYPIDFSQLLHALETQDMHLLAQVKMSYGFDLDNALQYASRQKEKNCMCERIFPVLNADASVAVCHLHRQATLANSIEDYSFTALEEQRRTNDYCRRCQNYGLHRLDLTLLN